jgi:two-component system, cell cycle response regulator
MQNAAIERVLSIPNLPTMPAVAVRVLDLATSRDASVREIASVIENDPALASKVLRTVNSSFFGLSRRCGSIQQALVFLGLHSLKSLVLGFTLLRSASANGEDEVGFDFPSYWRRSIYSAAAAREIAQRHRRCDPDEAFLTALVRDIGMIALWRAFGDRYLQIIDLSKGDHDRLCAVEQRTLDTDHAEISAELTARWRFPIAFAQAIRFHHRVDEVVGEVQPLARTIGLAATAASVLAPKCGPETLDCFYSNAREWFGIQKSEAEALLSGIVTHARELSVTFDLETGETPDVEAILSAAERIRSEQQLTEPGVPMTGDDSAEKEILELETIPESHVFSEDLARQFTLARRAAQGRIGVMLIGVDRARTLQQAFGMHGVEAALRHTLRRMQLVLPRNATVYRFVGAELAVMIPSVESDELSRIAEFIRRAACESGVEFASANGGEFPITVSIGVNMYDRDPATVVRSGVGTPDQLVSGAMFALAMGRRGSDRVVVYRRELKAQYEGA